MEGFDENSRLHAVGVSTDLKYAMQEAVELLGNEALRQYADRNRPAPSAEDLTRECLRYLYRLLFLFFAEAHPELGQRGCVHRSTRTATAWRHCATRNWHGCRTTKTAGSCTSRCRRCSGCSGWDTHARARGPEKSETHHDFVLEPVGSVLFEPEQTPHLDAVRFPDRVLSRVLELLSLSEPELTAGRDGVPAGEAAAASPTPNSA